MFVTFWIFKSPVYKGFRSPVFEDFPRRAFPANVPGTPCFIDFYAVYDPFWTPFLRAIFRERVSLWHHSGGWITLATRYSTDDSRMPRTHLSDGTGESPQRFETPKNPEGPKSSPKVRKGQKFSKKVSKKRAKKRAKS